MEATIEETRLGLGRTRAAREELRRAVPRQVAEARADLPTSFESVKTAELAFQQALETERLASARYNHDLADPLDLTVARTALAAAEGEQARARFDYKIAEAALDFATGGEARY